jgi:molybdopterin converting factor small subunit
MRYTMKVYVKLFATLVQSVPEAIRAHNPQEIRAGSPLGIELPEGSLLSDLVDHLELPREEVKVAFVNGRARKLDCRLSAGDEVGIFPPIGGG